MLVILALKMFMSRKTLRLVTVGRCRCPVSQPPGAWCRLELAVSTETDGGRQWEPRSLTKSSGGSTAGNELLEPGKGPGYGSLRYI